MKFRPISTILLICAALAPAGASAQAAPAQSPATAAAPAPIVYRNTQYGFCFALPASWKEFTIVTEQWQGTVFSSGQVVHGPQLRVRHPKWTADEPYQDIPLMVFTPAQWQHVEKADMSVSAAPIGPAKLGQNSRFVFALPPRWIGFTDDLGWQDLEGWMQQNRLQAPCGNKPAPITTIP